MIGKSKKNQNKYYLLTGSIHKKEIVVGCSLENITFIEIIDLASIQQTRHKIVN